MTVPCPLILKQWSTEKRKFPWGFRLGSDVMDLSSWISRSNPMGSLSSPFLAATSMSGASLKRVLLKTLARRFFLSYEERERKKKIMRRYILGQNEYFKIRLGKKC